MTISTMKMDTFLALHPGEKETEPQMDGFEKRQPVAGDFRNKLRLLDIRSSLQRNLGKTDDYKKFSAK
ncbi:MAG: hypothetical protein MZV63_10165 [Marinilabiliales bacterium]|nr:hypothetical protein [Marinilabiliales bacterium]